MFNEQGSYFLDFPRETVFEYMKQPENAAVVSPSLKSSRGLDEDIDGRPVVEATYDVRGLINGAVRLHPTKYEEGKHIRYEMYDDVVGYVDWYFHDEGDGTRFEYKTEVKFDVPLPNFILKRIATVLAEKELDAIVENLREELKEFDK